MVDTNFHCWRPVGVAALSILMACGDQPDVAEPMLSLSDITAVSLESAVNYDDWLTRVAGEVPGFAGVFIDDDGNLGLQLTDLSQEVQARKAIGALRLGNQYEDGRVVQVEHSFKQLAVWRNRIADNIIDLIPLNFVYLDVDEGLNRVVVAVVTDEDRQGMSQRLAILGIPPAGYIIRAVGLFESHQRLTDHLDTAQGGLEIDGPLGQGLDNCTLGVNGIYQGQRVFSTASHCSLTMGVVDPIQFWGQPSTGYLIGYEYHDPPFRITYPECPNWLLLCRESDVTLGRYESGVDAEVGVIANPIAEGSTVIDPVNPKYFISGTYWWPQVNQPVRMVGKTSGQSTGTVTSTCFLFYQSSINRWFTCQYLGDYDSGSGDSGAPIFIVSADSISVRLTGSHKGGGTGGALFSPWQGVYGDFGFIDLIYSTPPPPPPDPPTWVNIDFGPNQVKPNDFCTWFGSAGGGDPSYTFKWYKGPTLVQTDVGTSTELSMDTGTADFILKLVASNGSGSVQTTLDVDVTTSADPCFS